MQLSRPHSISTSDFIDARHKFHHHEGLIGYVDVAILLLELHTIARNLAGGPITASFKTQERSLYEPLKAILERNLPAKDLISIENPLYKTATPLKKTDLSIHTISHKGKINTDPNLICTHFIEIKSVFSGEYISKREIEDDLQKLIDCEKAYNATCFFVLTGLQQELRRSQAANTLMEKRTGRSFTYTLSDGTNIGLRFAGKHIATEPFVYVFEVSATRKKFGGSYRSGATYSIFQER